MPFTFGPNGACISSYTDLLPESDSCYLHMSKDEGSKGYTWMEAEFECRQRSGHLVSIHSKEEKKALADGRETWIGLYAGK